MGGGPTTALVAKRLEDAGVRLQMLPKSGLIAEVGRAEGPTVALRADLDALAVEDFTDDPG